MSILPFLSVLENMSGGFVGMLCVMVLCSLVHPLSSYLLKTHPSELLYGHPRLCVHRCTAPHREHWLPLLVMDRHRTASSPTTRPVCVLQDLRLSLPPSLLRMVILTAGSSEPPSQALPEVPISPVSAHTGPHPAFSFQPAMPIKVDLVVEYFALPWSPLVLSSLLSLELYWFPRL